MIGGMNNAMHADCECVDETQRARTDEYLEVDGNELEMSVALERERCRAHDMRVSVTYTTGKSCVQRGGKISTVRPIFWVLLHSSEEE